MRSKGVRCQIVRFRPAIVLALAASCGGGGLGSSGAGSDASHTGADPTASGGGLGDAGRDGNPPAVTCYALAAYSGAWVADPRMCLQTFAAGLGAVRQMAFAPNGDLFVNDGTLLVLWDGDGSGTAGTDEQPL